MTEHTSAGPGTDKAPGLAGTDLTELPAPGLEVWSFGYKVSQHVTSKHYRNASNALETDQKKKTFT